MARDLGHMTDALRAYLSTGKALTHVVPLSVGHSNETYLLEGLHRVLRAPPCGEGLLPPYDMAFQHSVLAAVARSPGGPPVPRVHELCTDPGVIGDPFFVMERIDGEAFEYAVPAWLAAGGPAMRDRVCRQWIGAIAAVHRMPAETMPGPRTTPREEAAHWLDVAREAEAPPLLVELLEELVARPPRTSGPPTPVHGDPKVANCLWRDGRLAAVLDWEMAHVGEPLTDLGYLTSFFDMGEAMFAGVGFDLPGWWDRARVVAEWGSLTGRTAVDLRRYEILGMGKIAAIVCLGVHLFRTGRASDPRFSGWEAIVPAYLDVMRRRAAT